VILQNRITPKKYYTKVSDVGNKSEKQETEGNARGNGRLDVENVTG